MEISLAIDTPDGIVLVVGCSHPTIEKIAEAARSVIDKPIHLVLGGTHLLPATPDEIARLATTLRDDLKVEWIAPTHCTGEPAFAILKASFGDHYLYAGLGTTVELGPKVATKAEAGQQPMHAMDLEDLVDYRVALAHQMLDALADGRVHMASAQP
jgi:7,8-dihydropterin-6-yl-methyl-4-(beta-D-ribofuranosyl)aminobenzene 5'-phosphate synthase